MLRLELIEITEADVKYRYYPEDSKEYGIVIFRKTTRERDIEEKADGYDTSYAAHASGRILRKEHFPERRYCSLGLNTTDHIDWWYFYTHFSTRR